MKSAEFLELLEKIGKGTVSVSEASALIGKGKRYTSLFLQRISAQGGLLHIFKGIYATRSTTIWEIATSLAQPSYITGIAALHLNGIVDQFPNEIDVFNARYSKKIKIDIRDGRYLVRLIKVRPFRIFGYSREMVNDGIALMVASPEKAVVDSLYVLDIMLYEYVKDAASELIAKKGKAEVETLLEYAKRMKSKVLLKRLGYMLDQQGYDMIGELKPLISKKYEPLFARPRIYLGSKGPDNEGRVNSKWMLIIGDKHDYKK